MSSQKPVICEKCNVEMEPVVKDQPFDDMPTTVSSTSPEVNTTASQYFSPSPDVANNMPEYMRYVCPKCKEHKLIKIT